MWLKVDSTLPRHPKVARLARLLGASRFEAVGLLIALWSWTLDYAEDGCLSRFSAAELADGLGWPGDPEQLVTGLAGSGLLDQAEGGLAVHDWEEHMGQLVASRQANRQRVRDCRARQRAAEVPPDRDNAGVMRRVMDCNALEKRREEKSRVEESREDRPESSASSSSPGSGDQGSQGGVASNEATPEACRQCPIGRTCSKLEPLAQRYDEAAASDQAEMLAAEAGARHRAAAAWSRLSDEQREEATGCDWRTRRFITDCWNLEQALTSWRTNVGRVPNGAEAKVLSEAVASVLGEAELVEAAIEKCATETDRPNVRFFAAILKRLASEVGLWEPVGTLAGRDEEDDE